MSFPQASKNFFSKGRFFRTQCSWGIGTFLISDCNLAALSAVQYPSYYRPHPKDDGRLCFQSVHHCGGVGGVPQPGPDGGGSTPDRSRQGVPWPGPGGGAPQPGPDWMGVPQPGMGTPIWTWMGEYPSQV